MSKRSHASLSGIDTVRKLLKRPRTSSRRSPSPAPPGPSESGGAFVPPVDAHLPHTVSGTSNSESTSRSSADAVHTHQPPNSLGGDGHVNHFDNLLNRTDPHRTLAQDVRGIAHEGFKGGLVMADTVGYALPPLKAAATGANRLMTVIDKAEQNKRGFEAIQETLDAIISVITKYKQHGSQGAQEEAAGPSRVADFSTAMKAHKDEIGRVQNHGYVRRAIENVKDGSLITQSFRDIGLAKGIFNMGTMLRVEDMVQDILGMLREETTRRLQTDTASYVEATTKEILQILRGEETTRGPKMDTVEAMVKDILQMLREEVITLGPQMDATLHAVQSLSEDKEMTRVIQSLPHAKHASYNTRQSPDDIEPQGCMAGTRVQILAELEQWALDDTAPKVYWLNGMAGTGKSSIAHTLSKILDEKQMLGASFFCSRSASQEVRDASLIIPTVASRLSQASPLLRSAMSQAIENEPDVGSLQTLSMQFRLLLVQPIQRVLDPSIKTYKIVVVDALDECTKLGTVEKLIQAVVEFTPDIPLKFFISSRDQTTIRNAFHHNPMHLPKILSLHSVERAIVQEDIKTYLQASLSAIAQRFQQPISWPPVDELEILLERSDRLFIYAATAVRYIGAPDVDFRKRLSHITRLTPSRMQTGVIDSLYNDIMQQAFHSKLEPDEVSPRRQTLSAVVFLLDPLSLNDLASLLTIDSLQARVALAPFRSVIHVSAADIGPIALFHASFRDFIVQPSRCEKHFLDVSEGHRLLTVECLRCLNQSLQCNISNLDSNTTHSLPYESNALQGSLRYSCLHWASHFVHAFTEALEHSSVIEVQELISEFVNEHLLHWFECLSVLKELESGIKSLDRASEAISAFSEKPVGFEGISPLLEDALRFLQFAFEPIKQQPLNTYRSALVWTPGKSLMRERYAATLRGTPQVILGLSQFWQPLVHVIPHAREVTSVAFAPDGSRLVSGSKDQTVRVWNTATGEKVAELEGHTGRVMSVAFSHEKPGRFIVSGSGDSTVRVWNARTYETLHLLKGHKRGVMSVSLSRDDKYVVSGSDDTFIRIWNTATGQLFRELKGHSDMVKCVAFSPDCQHIASGSYRELWVWRTDGIIEHKLEPPSGVGWMRDVSFSHDGHRIVCNQGSMAWRTTGQYLSVKDTYERIMTSSVAYSPDDGEIASGLKNGEVLIWNSATGMSHYWLEGHSSRVTSVAFSPDGSRIASGSDEKTVRIWDTSLRDTDEHGISSERLRFVALSHDSRRFVFLSGSKLVQSWNVAQAATKMKELFYSGLDRVTSCALARDGNRVALGWNKMVWIWDPAMNVMRRKMMGHSDVVLSVAFSHDGSRVVSGSSDKTVRIWDYHAGKQISLYQHSDEVSSVAFSRDYCRVVFGSDDQTVRIWNPATAEIESELTSRTSTAKVKSVAFSHDGSHVVSGWSDGTVWIWNVLTNESSLLSERIQLSDGTRIHSLSNGQFHIYDPADQETTNDISPYPIPELYHGECGWVNSVSGICFGACYYFGPEKYPRRLMWHVRGLDLSRIIPSPSECRTRLTNGQTTKARHFVDEDLQRTTGLTFLQQDMPDAGVGCRLHILCTVR